MLGALNINLPLRKLRWEQLGQLGTARELGSTVAASHKWYIRKILNTIYCPTYSSEPQVLYTIYTLLQNCPTHFLSSHFACCLATWNFYTVEWSYLNREQHVNSWACYHMADVASLSYGVTLRAIFLSGYYGSYCIILV